MQIYFKVCVLYDFDWQKAFKARYMAVNLAASQKHQKYNMSNVKYRGKVSAKS